MKSTPRPTLADVAKRAKVSLSTASLAFSGSGPVAPATKQRVLDAAEELKYAGPNPLGRQLRSGRSGIVGVVIGDQLRHNFRDPVSVQVLDGLVSTLGGLGLGVLLIPGDPGSDTKAVAPLLETAAMDVAIFIWGTYPRDPRITALQHRGVPIVVGEGGIIPGCPIIEIDDRSGFEQLTRHLHSLGHRRFATITLPFHQDRRAGWALEERYADMTWPPTLHRLQGLDDAGVDVVGIYETKGSVLENGKAAAFEVLNPANYPAGQQPTAILAQSDLLASGAILAARELGLRVPEDVSITGFDGLDLPWMSPDVLTSVRQPIPEKGAAMARAAHGLLKGENPGNIMLPVELIQGTTTGPPPVASH